MVTYNVDREVFDPRIDIERYYHDAMKVKPMKFFTNENNKGKNEDFMVHAIVLSCSTNPNNSRKSVTSHAKTEWNGNKKSKMTRTNQQVTYNRYFILGDLANPPECFAIITRSSTDSQALLQQTSNECFIAMECFIAEPSITTSTVGSTILLSDEDAHKPLLPARPFHPLSSTTTFMKDPSVPNTPNYFILNSRTVSLGRVGISDDVSCTGFECDRQRTKTGCACLHASNSTSLVYSFDVTFNLPESVQRGEQETVQNFRSLKTTKLFFHDFEDHATTISPAEGTSKKFIYRKKIKLMVEFINQADIGGWTVIGWYQRGQTIELSNENEKVDNNYINLHLVSVFPTLYNDKVKNNDAFKALQIKTEEHPTPPNPQPAAAAATAVAAASTDVHPTTPTARTPPAQTGRARRPGAAS